MFQSHHHNEPRRLEQSEGFIPLIFRPVVRHKTKSQNDTHGKYTTPHSFDLCERDVLFRAFTDDMKHPWSDPHENITGHEPPIADGFAALNGLPKIANVLYLGINAEAFQCEGLRLDMPSPCKSFYQRGKHEIIYYGNKIIHPGQLLAFIVIDMTPTADDLFLQNDLFQEECRTHIQELEYRCKRIMVYMYPQMLVSFNKFWSSAETCWKNYTSSGTNDFDSGNPRHIKRIIENFMIDHKHESNKQRMGQLLHELVGPYPHQDREVDSKNSGGSARDEAENVEPRIQESTRYDNEEYQQMQPKRPESSSTIDWDELQALKYMIMQRFTFQMRYEIIGKAYTTAQGPFQSLIINAR